MEIQETLYLGIVMGYQSKSQSNCCEPPDFTHPIVWEFCPGNLVGGFIRPSGRMNELVAAGFAPIAMDTADADLCYMFAHNGTSDAVRVQLMQDREAIFKAAAEYAELEEKQ